VSAVAAAVYALLFPVIVGAWFFVYGFPLILYMMACVFTGCCCGVCFKRFNDSIINSNTTMWSPAARCLSTVVGYVSSPLAAYRVARMHPLRAKADALIADRSSFTYVVPMNVFATLPQLLKHEVALRHGLLLKMPIKDIVSFGSSGSEVVFVSHKWFGNAPDKDGFTFQAAKRYALGERVFFGLQAQASGNLMQKYMWIDYMCVPQDDADERLRHLLAIPELLSKCQVEVRTHPALEDAYRKSVWCLLEVIASERVPREPAGPGELTIYDKNDLYGVVPGFIALACLPRYRLRVLLDRARNRTLVTVLDMLIQFHDQANGAVVAVPGEA